MEVINKINITAEARFDLGECVGLEAFDWRTLKSETEEYINRQASAGRIPWWGYFRADYVDEDSGRRLKLFFYKGGTFGNMQIWDLKGICEADDWTQDAEDEGHIRAWLKTSIGKLPADEDDWAVRVRVNEIIKNTEKTLWINVLEEVTSVFECGRDKETAERLAFLQSAHFDHGGRRRVEKKTRQDRKMRDKP